MTAAAQGQRTPGEIDAALPALEQLLRDLIECYRRMEVLAGLRHDAIRAAAPQQLASCIGEENLVVQRVAELEKKRIRIVGDVAQRLGSPDRAQTRVSWIAEKLGGAAGERLAHLAGELRDLIARVMKKNETIKAAAEMLASHIDGLIKAVAASLNHARTYGRKGIVAPGARITSALDMVT